MNNKLDLAQDFNLSNMTKDYAREKKTKGFKVDDISDKPAMTPPNVTLKEIEEKTGLNFDDFLRGSQGNTDFLKTDAKDSAENLTFGDPATLREKFNSADNKNKKAPK